MIIRSMINIGQ